MQRNKIILGTANFGNKYGISGGLSREECFDLLDAAWDLGVQWLDTARSYGDAESIIGQYIRQHSNRWNVISKGDTLEDRKASEDALQMCPAMYWLHHRRTFALPIYFSGISVYNLDELTGVAEAGYKYVCFPLNLVDIRFLPTLSGPHMYIVRSVFLQGQAWQAPPIFGIPFAHLCWNFVTHYPCVNKVVIGADSIKQLETTLTIPEYEVNYSDIGKRGRMWIKSV